MYTNCVTLADEQDQGFLENRVFGGEKLLKDDHEFPWLVAMHHRVQEVFFCAGSLISVNHVLSGEKKNQFLNSSRLRWHS